MSHSDTKVIEKMDTHKTSTATSTKASEGKRLIEFVGEVKQELKKVEWTSKEELTLYTKLVLAGTFLVGMGIYFMDLLIQGVLSGVNLLFRLFFG